MNTESIGCYFTDINNTVTRSEKEELIHGHLPYVISIAKKYIGQGLSIEDLIGEGNIGLMKAVDKYDPSQGAFTTYSVHWIRQSIIMALSNNRLVRLPLNQIQKMHYKTGSYQRERPVELDRQVYGDEDDRTVGDLLPADDRITAHENIADDTRKVSALLNTLSERDAIVIKMHFGIDYPAALGSDVIAERIGVSSTRINQIVRNSLKSMANIIK